MQTPGCLLLAPIYIQLFSTASFYQIPQICVPALQISQFVLYQLLTFEVHAPFHVKPVFSLYWTILCNVNTEPAIPYVPLQGELYTYCFYYYYYYYYYYYMPHEYQSICMTTPTTTKWLTYR